MAANDLHDPLGLDRPAARPQRLSPPWGWVVLGGLGLVTCGLGSLLYILMLPLGIIPLGGAYKAYNGEWEGYPALSQFGRE